MSREEYLALTVKALRERAAELAIPGRSRLSKADLVEAILAAEASVEPVAEPVEVAPVEVAPAAAPVEAAPAEPVEDTLRVEPPVSPEQPAPAVEAAPVEEAMLAEEAASIPENKSIGPELIAVKESDPEAIPPASSALPAQTASAEPSEPQAPPFIDRGPPLPSYPAPEPRALVRDPETVFVYWDGPASTSPTEVVATDRDGRVAHRFETAGQDGYVRVPVAALASIELRSDGESQALPPLPTPPPPSPVSARRAPAPTAEETAWREAAAALFPAPPTPYPLGP